MPFIQSKTSFPMTKEEEKKVKEGLGRAIQLIPGKTEDWLMVGFEQNLSMYFRGNQEDKTAYVNVKVFGSTPKSACEKLTKEICRIYEAELQVPADRIYVTFDDCEKWGWNGSMF